MTDRRLTGPLAVWVAAVCLWGAALAPARSAAEPAAAPEAAAADSGLGWSFDTGG